MKNLINIANGFCLNFTKKFKYAGLIFTALTLTSFSCSKAMNKETELHNAYEKGDFTEIKNIIYSLSKCRTTVLESILRNEFDKSYTIFFLNRGANVNTSNDFGFTPLHFACINRNNDKEVISLLLRNGANIEAQITEGLLKDWTPLNLACLTGNLEAAKTLVDAGARLNAVDSESHLKKLLLLIETDLLIKLKKDAFKDKKPLNLNGNSNNLNNCNVVCELQSKEL